MQIKFFKKEKSFKKHGLGFKPDLFWQLVVFIGSVLILASFTFGYYLFMQTKKEPILKTGGATGQVKTVKKERIEKVLDYFSAREQKSNQILNSSSSIVDPSL